MTEIICGGCGKPLFYGEVTAAFECRCRRCNFQMVVYPSKPVPSLALAIVEAMASAPAVNSNGQTVCNCESCRHARN
jgi:DNA-directed RNA polymerase subunit RPC12/RpoP